MADINKLKDKIKSTIYPNGKGAINASDHQAMLLDMADGMAETDTKLTELSEEIGIRNYNKKIASGSWTILDKSLTFQKGQKIAMKISAFNISRLILGIEANRVFDSLDPSSYSGDLSDWFTFEAKSSITGVEIYMVYDESEQTEIKIKTALVLEVAEQGEDLTNLALQVGKNTNDIEMIAKQNEDLHLLQVIASPNLLNPSDPDVLFGYYIRAGSIAESSAYNTSGYIPVKSNTKYYKSDAYGTDFRFVNYYDKNHKFIPGGSTELTSEFTTPDDCAYVRVSNYASVWGLAQVAEEFIEYVPFSKTLGLAPSSITDNRKIATLNDLNNVLYGKKWAVVGDSFTAEFGNPLSDWIIEDGRYAGKSKVYGYIIGNRNNMTLQWLGAGGKTMATPADGSFTNAFSLSEYKNIDADVDYITIYLGINDSHHAPGSTGDDGEDKSGEIPLGTIDDTTNATFYGAWNVVIPYLLENHPFAHIGIIVSNGCDTSEYRDAEIAIAKKYGIPYIDLNGDERTPFMLRSTNANIPLEVRRARTRVQSIDYDGSITGSANQHPNKDAHEFQADFIETWMKSL